MTLTSGTVIAEETGSLGAGGQVTFNGPGTTLDLRGLSATLYTNGINTSAFGGTITVENSSPGNGVVDILSLADTLGTNTIVMSPGSLTTTNTSYGLTFSGTTSFAAANTNATFTINGNGSGKGTLSFTGGFNTDGNTNTLTFNTGSGTGANSASISGAFIGADGTLNLAGNAPVTVGPLTNTANILEVSGTGIYTFSGTNTFTGGVILNDPSGTNIVTANGNLGSGQATFNTGGITLDLRAPGTTSGINTTANGGMVTVEPSNPGGGIATAGFTANTFGANTLTVAPGPFATVATGTVGLFLNGPNTLTGNAVFQINNATGVTTTLTFGYVNGGGNSMTFQGAGNVAQSGDWAGGGTSVVFGSSFTGTAILNQLNSFTGGVTLNSGTLEVTQVSGIVGAGGPLGSGGTFTINGGSISGGGIASNPVALNGNFNVNGPGSGILTLTGNATMSTNIGITLTAGTLVFSGPIGDGGNGYGLTLNGTNGLIALSAANTFTGPVTISSGTLQLGRGNVFTQGIGSTTGTLPTSSTITNNGTLVFQEATAVVQGTDFASGISGSGSLVQNGPGMVTLVGNSYTGTTTLSGGTLQADSAMSGASLGDGGTITFSGGTLQLTANDHADYSPRIANSTRAISVDVNGQTLAFASTLGASNTGGLMLTSTAGGGTLTLSAANAFTGGVTISAGTLQTAGSGTLGNTAGTLSVNAGTLDLDGTNQTVGNFRGIGVVLDNSASTTLTFTIGNGNTGGGNFAGTIENNAGAGGTLALVKVGSGAITLSGANTYTGGTTINGGTLAVNNSSSSSSALGSGNVVISGGTLTAGSGGGFIVPGSGNSVTIQSGGTLAAAAGGPLTISGANGTLVLDGGAVNSFTLPSSGPSGTSLVSVTTLNPPGSGLATPGSVTVNILNAGSLSMAVGQSYDLLNYSNGPASSGASAAASFSLGTAAPAGYAWQLETTGSQLDLVVSGGSQPSLQSFNGAPSQFGGGASWSVQGGGASYAGLSSGVSGQTQATSANGVGPLLTDDGGGDPLYVQIIAGSNSGNFTNNGAAAVSMAWRNRTLQEAAVQEGGTPSSPPLPAANSALISNVLNLTGMSTSGGEPVQTDPFVLQMNYDAALLGDEAAEAASGAIYLAWLNPNGGGSGIPLWQNAIAGDTGGLTTPGAPIYLGSFLNYVNSLDGNANFPLFTTTYTTETLGNLSNAQLEEILGDCGVDTANHDAWAVIDHNSEFAVAAVPEPATLSLVACGFVALLWYGSRRRRRAGVLRD